MIRFGIFGVFNSILKLKGTVLIIGYVWVETTSAAGSRMLQLIKYFLEHYDTVVFGSSAQKTQNSLNLNVLGVDEIVLELNSSSFDVFIKKLNPEIVLFDRFMIEEQFSWRVVENCPNAIRILDTEDLHSLRKTRHQCIKNKEEFSFDKLLNSQLALREVASILRCDLSLIISSFEMDVLKNVFKIDASLLLHLPFMLQKLTEKDSSQWLSYDKREHFVFVGNFLHAPNVDAVLQLKSIWTTIRKKIPKAELYIYGAYPTQQVKQLHNVKSGFLIKGYTDDIQKVVSCAKVVLAPLRFGAGIKGKLTEAMQLGTPSVTTKIGAEGMTDDYFWNGIISNLNDFAENAVQLYENEELWQASQKKGRIILNKYYDASILKNELINSIKIIKNSLLVHRIQNYLGRLLFDKQLNSLKYMSKWIELKNNNTK